MVEAGGRGGCVLVEEEPLHAVAEGYNALALLVDLPNLMVALGGYGCGVGGLWLSYRRVSNASNLLVQRLRPHGQRVRNAHAAELPHKREEEHAGKETLGV